MKLKLTKEQVELLEIGSKLKYSDNEYLYFLPMWFKIEVGSNIAEVFNLENLPDNIKKIIEKFRL